jgi:hypothetical protein
VVRGRVSRGDLTNVQCKAIQNCHNESPSVQQIHPNKNGGKKLKKRK